MTTTTGVTGSTGTQADLQAGQANLSSSYDTFLKLLTTQLQNQDPLSPLDANQFTQQLVQMTGVQQQLLTNQLLQQMVTAQGGGTVAGAVGLIGKTISASSANATLSNGAATWTYNLASTAANATLSVSDSSGKVVWSGAAPDLTAGSHTVSWNGKNGAGVQLADGGTYTLKVSATDPASATVTSTVSVKGAVTSVSEVNGTTMVNIGATQVPLSTVSEVSTS